MLKFKKNQTDFTIPREELLENVFQHKEDVYSIMRFLAVIMNNRVKRHDITKIKYFDDFLNDFKDGFKNSKWFLKHIEEERHHLSEVNGPAEDVDLIDVLEYISDCVAAGLVRNGKVYEIKINQEVLMKAFENTVKLVLANCEVEDS